MQSLVVGKRFVRDSSCVVGLSLRDQAREANGDLSIEMRNIRGTRSCLKAYVAFNRG